MPTNPERSEKFHALLEKWDKQLGPEFLRVALDLQEFWQSWSHDPNDVKDSLREIRLLKERMSESLQMCCFNARPETLESLAEDD